MLNLIHLELLKLRKKPRSYLGFAGLAAISVLVATGMRYGGPPEGVAMGGMPREMLMIGSYLTAGFMASFILEGTLVSFLSLFVAMVSGDLISGEAADGTLRSAMSRPVGRLSFYLSKMASGFLYSILLTLFFGLIAYVVGLIALGRGPVPTAFIGFAVYTETEGLVRIIGAYLLACAPMIAVSGLSLLVSTVVNNSLAAVVAPMMLIFSLLIITEISFFKPIKPYLFTTYFEVWRQAYAPQVDWQLILRSLGWLAIYTITFCSIGASVFCRKDILS